MLNKEMFSELEVGGNLFGSPRYFDSKKRGTVFSRCDSTKGSRVDAEQMISQLREYILRQVSDIKRDFESAADTMYLIARSDRDEMIRFLDTLESALKRLGGHSFITTDLIRTLNPSQRSEKDSRSKPRGRNGKELCSRDYMSKITSDIFGSERLSSSSFSDAISRDVKSIIDSIYDDLKDALRSIYRVSEKHKSNIIDAVEELKRVASSNNGSDVVRILDYKGKIKFTIIRREIEFTSDELLKGHQDIEDFMRSRTEVEFESRILEIDCAEMYCYDISSMVRAILELDTRQKKLYIKLHIGNSEVFRTQFRMYSNIFQLFTDPNRGKELREDKLTCRLLTDEEIIKYNRSDWNSNLHQAGTRTSQAGQLGKMLPVAALGVALIPKVGIPIAAGMLKAAPVAPFIEQAGRGLQAVSGTFDFSRDVAEERDFYLYYGNLNDGYGGIFCGKNKTFKE
jgi:hypothetical protein